MCMTFIIDMRLLVPWTNERLLLQSRVGEKNERTVRRKRPRIPPFFVHSVRFIICHLWLKQKWVIRWVADILGFSCVLYPALQQLLSGEDMRPAPVSSANELLEAAE